VAIHADTQVVITMKSLITGVIGFVILGGAVLWTVLSFTIGGVRDDVTAIRTSVQALQTADQESVKETNNVNVRLTDQIQGLRTDFVKYSERFDNLSRNLETTNKSIYTLTNRLDGFRDQLQAIQSTWNDPKTISQITEAVRQANGGSVIILPFPSAPQPVPPKPN